MYVYVCMYVFNYGDVFVLCMYVDSNPNPRVRFRVRYLLVHAGLQAPRLYRGGHGELDCGRVDWVVSVGVIGWYLSG